MCKPPRNDPLAQRQLGHIGQPSTRCYKASLSKFMLALDTSGRINILLKVERIRITGREGEVSGCMSALQLTSNRPRRCGTTRADGEQESDSLSPGKSWGKKRQNKNVDNDRISQVAPACGRGKAQSLANGGKRAI